MTNNNIYYAALQHFYSKPENKNITLKYGDHVPMTVTLTEQQYIKFLSDVMKPSVFAKSFTTHIKQTIRKGLHIHLKLGSRFQVFDGIKPGSYFDYRDWREAVLKQEYHKGKVIMIHFPGPGHDGVRA